MVSSIDHKIIQIDDSYLLLSDSLLQNKLVFLIMTMMNISIFLIVMKFLLCADSSFKFMYTFWTFCSFWDWEQGTKVNYIYNENLKNTKITAMDFINPHDESLLLCGTGKLIHVLVRLSCFSYHIPVFSIILHVHTPPPPPNPPPPPLINLFL